MFVIIKTFGVISIIITFLIILKSFCSHYLKYIFYVFLTTLLRLSMNYSQVTFFHGF